MLRRDYDLVPNGPAKKGLSGIEWNSQNVTFLLSLVVQLVVLIVSLVAIFETKDLPDVLSTVLILETVVQLVELAWYTIVGLLFAFGDGCCGVTKQMSFGVEYRYLDWFITTPTMLITLFFSGYFFDNPCLDNEGLRQTVVFGGLVALIIVADWIMLYIGLDFEMEGRLNRRFGYWALVFGFFPLACAFIPSFVVLFRNPSWEFWLLSMLTLFVWSLYGAVPLYFYPTKDDDPRKKEMVDLLNNEKKMKRNACFNILDLFSKNAFGLVLSIIALEFDREC
jgi:hypothetical protein